MSGWNHTENPRCHADDQRLVSAVYITVSGDEPHHGFLFLLRPFPFATTTDIPSLHLSCQFPRVTL